MTQRLFQRIVLATNLDASQSVYTGLQGELTYSTDNKQVYIHDGITQGGFNIMADPALEIARGRVPGLSHINKFGRNASAANGEEIWDGSAVYVFPATALMTSISQTTDQAAMRGQTVEVQGLDASWDAVTQTATLDASDTTTVVTLTTALIRCHRMRVTANVIADQDIRVHNAGESQDYAIILAGNNQTLMAIYTIPNGKTGYLNNVYATVNPGGGAPVTLTIGHWEKDNDNSHAERISHVMGISADVDAYGHYHHPFKPPIKYTQKTDIFCRAASSGTVDVSAGFDITLVDN